MNKEKNKLLNFKISKENSGSKFRESIYNSLFSLYCLILEDPIESLWLEVFHILSGYLQLMAYQFDSIVNKYICNN